MPPAARITDMHTCPVPTHVGGPTVVGDPTVLIGYLPAARVGDALVCATGPDTIARGESTVTIGHKQAARLGDPTTHGGVLVMGCPTVLIGSTAQIEALKTDKPICEECEKARNTTLMIERRYHDDEPVEEAEFEVELFDKTIIKGKLDKQGRAKIEGVPPEIARIRFGPDVRPFERTDKSPNEAFRETMSEAEIDAMVEERMKRP
jgi:uncharacterized Zn-binding protein involved in type VI secretion